MAKKRATKKSTKKKRLTKAELEEALIENFVKMQKVQTNLSIKFEELSDNISKLLELFEISAKSFIQKQEGSGEGDLDLINKLDTLVDQNKTIAQGLTLMEEKLRHRVDEQEGHHSEAELHGFYDRPRPGSHPGL